MLLQNIMNLEFWKIIATKKHSGLYASMKMVYAQFEITLYFKQSGRRNATEPKAHAIERRDRRPSHECSPVPSSPVQLLPLPIQYPPCCPPSFFARARTNNVSAIFERYHDSHRPGLLRVEPWGNNVVGSRNPGRQVQVAVCACVVGEGRGGGRSYNICGICGLPYGHLHFAYGTKSHGYMCL